MNSPDPISPSPSTPSSSSPPGEEINFQAPNNGSDKGFINSLTSHLTNTFSGAGSSKRRLPGGGSFGASSSNRDPKSRRRENSGRQDSANWEGKAPGGGGGKREKDELLDQNLVDFLRKEIGDPFQEPSLNSL